MTKKRGNIAYVLFIIILCTSIIGFLYNVKAQQNLFWDESVYVAMAKNTIDSNSGFIEVIRPIGLPYIVAYSSIFITKTISFITKSDINPLNMIIKTAKIEEALIAFLFLIIIAYITNKLFIIIKGSLNKKTIISKKSHYARISSLIAILLMISNQVFYQYAGNIYTAIPASLLIISVILLAYFDYIFIAGLISALVFSIRYPLGIVVLNINLALILTWILMIFKRYSYIDTLYKHKRKIIYKQFKKIIKYNIGFLIGIIPIIYYNYLRGISEFSQYCFNSTLKCNIFNAIITTLRPLIKASNTVSNFKLNNSSLFYFNSLINNYPYLLLFIIGILILIITLYKLKSKIENIKPLKIIDKDYAPKYVELYYQKIMMLFAIILMLIIPYLYFETNPHKELRYAMSFLPYAVILSSIVIGLSIEKIIAQIKSNTSKIIISTVMIIFILALVVLGLQNSASSSNLASYINSSNANRIDDLSIKQLNQILNKNITIASSTPTISEFTNAKITVYYQDIDEITRIFNNANNDLLLINNRGNNEQNVKKLGNLINNYNLIFAKKILGEDIFIFSKNQMIKYNQSMINQSLIEKYIDSTIGFSKTPNDKKTISFRLDGVGYTFFDKNIQNESILLKFIDINKQNNISMTIGFVPENLNNIEINQTNEIRMILNNSLIEVAQHGIDFKSKNVIEETDLYNDLIKQKKQIKQSKNILEKTFGNKIKTFFPAFSNANDNTIKVLEELNYSVISSAKWDNINMSKSNLTRLDLDMYGINNWVLRDYKTDKELINEINGFITLKNYAVVELSIFKQNDYQFIDYYNKTIQHFINKSDYQFLSIYNLSNFIECVKSYKFKKLINKNTNSPKTIKKGEIFENYMLISNTLNACNGVTFKINKNIIIHKNTLNKINIKNINQNKAITVCNRDSCHIVNSNKSVEI